MVFTPTIKGFALIAGKAWTEQHFDAEGYGQLERMLSDEFRYKWNNLVDKESYPLRWLDELECAIAEVGADTVAEKSALVEAFAGYVAKNNLSTVMKLLMKFITPTLLVKKLPQIWGKYIVGAEATYELGPEKNQGALIIEGFPHLRWLSANNSGWLLAAFDLLGVEGVDIEEVNNAPDDPHPTSFRWEIRWQIEQSMN